MPKMKGHSATQKRFRMTGGGKIKRGRAYRRHHAWAKTTKQNLASRGIAYVATADAAKVARLLQG